MNLFFIILPIFFISTLPQLYQTIQSKRADDFNLMNLGLNILGNSLIIIHGFMKGDIGILLLSVYYIFYNSVFI